jgi:hypothetical protein
MKNKIFVFLSLFISFIFHVLFLSSSFVYVGGKGKPFILCWPNILDKKYLYMDKKDTSLPYWMDFSSFGLKDYFFQFIERNNFPSKERIPYYPFLLNYTRDIKEKEILYLWKKSFDLDSKRGERVVYKIFVSPYGRIILIYPEILPFDSQETLYFQTYIKEASVVLKDKFIWTNLEEVIK